ncbi:hypothetical protein GCM10027295_16640 [Pseudaeromonas pectinilytica]
MLLLIDLSVSALSAWAICQPAVGGSGLRTEAAVLNNPAAGCMPTAGKAPGCGMSFTGREPHAIPGVTLPLAVILTAHRLQPPLHPARQTAWSLGDEWEVLRQYGSHTGMAFLLPFFPRGRLGGGD